MSIELVIGVVALGVLMRQLGFSYGQIGGITLFASIVYAVLSSMAG